MIWFLVGKLFSFAVFFLYTLILYVIYAASNKIPTDFQDGAYIVGGGAREVFTQRRWQYNLWIAPPPPST